MVTAQVVREVPRSADHVFDVIVRHQGENHPRWEKEVLEVRQLDAPGLGARSVMVRHEMGRTREVENTCVEYVDGRRAAYRHDEPTMRFAIAFEIVPTGQSSSRITVDVTLQPLGALRLMAPMFALGAQRRSERITDRMCDVIVSTPAYSKD